MKKRGLAIYPFSRRRYTGQPRGPLEEPVEHACCGFKLAIAGIVDKAHAEPLLSTFVAEYPGQKKVWPKKG